MEKFELKSFVVSVFSVSFLLFFIPNPLLAMTFDVVERDGREVLLASGPIELGDEAAYAVALDRTPIQAHGARVVYLDSPGGSVDAALAMSAINDTYTVHTVIPAGAMCASACASILYISGTYRTMSTLGKFGQHSCSLGGIPNADCNEELAQHAIMHGVAHGAVKAFVTYTPPEDIVWFGAGDLDCWGISAYPFSLESGYERIDPCMFQILKGDKPKGQIAWRVDLKNDGYRAFARPIADDEREFELGVFCDEKSPGQMFVEFYVSGPKDLVASSLVNGAVLLTWGSGIPLSYSIEQVESAYTRITFAVPKIYTRELLVSSDIIGVRLETAPGFQTMESFVGSTTSREALLFVANHCINAADN